MGDENSKWQRMRKNHGPDEKMKPEISCLPHQKHVLNLVFLLVTLGTYAICLGFRLFDLPTWNLDGFHVFGERLLGTPDAYYYLAAAQGTSLKTGYPEFVALTKAIHEITGIPYTTIAFWTPAIFAPLVIIPVALLARSEGLMEAVFPAGLVMACAGMFFLRTKLGYYDQDMLILFLPFSYATGIFYLLRDKTFPEWNFRKTRNASQQVDSSQLLFFIAKCLAVGILGWGYIVFYPQGVKLLLVLWFFGLALAVLLSRDFLSMAILCIGLIFVLLPPVLHEWGIMLSMILLFSFYILKNKIHFLTKPWSIGFFALSLTALLVFLSLNYLPWIISKLSHQAQIQTVISSGTLQMPTFLQTVAEARPAVLDNLPETISAKSWIFFMGLAGYLYLIWKRPLYTLFLPFFVAGLSSLVLGIRFTMYGSIVIGLGFGFGFAFFLREILSQKKVIVVVSFIALFATWQLGSIASSKKPVPTISVEYALAMKEIKERTSPEARVWSWWDLGFATQFYAHRPSLSDGHRQRPDLLYVLGLVHMTQSPMQAAQVMKMTTYNQKAFLDPGNKDYDPKRIWILYNRSPLVDVQNHDPAKVQALMDILSKENFRFPDNMPEQYLAFTWSMIRAMLSISMYGTWNFVENRPRDVKRLIYFSISDSVSFEKGYLKISDRIFPMDSWHEIGHAENRSLTWDNDSGNHALLNTNDGSGYLVDDDLFQSMMIQMLIANPATFEPYFELVIDKKPDVRVYRLR